MTAKPFSMAGGRLAAVAGKQRVTLDISCARITIRFQRMAAAPDELVAGPLGVSKFCGDCQSRARRPGSCFETQRA